MKAWREANAELDIEYRKATETVYFASILALYEAGWRKLRIERFLDKAIEVYTECRSTRQMSLVQMCDEQLGIEVRNDSNESYREKPYICEEDWQAKKDTVMNKMNPVQRRCYLIRVRQKMKEWMFPQVLASILLALHRKESWGADRIEQFCIKVQGIRDAYKNNIEKLKAAVEESTGMQYVWTKNGEFALLDGETEKGITG